LADLLAWRSAGSRRKAGRNRADNARPVVDLLGKPRWLAAAAKCFADRSGATAIEYAIIAGIIVIAITALVNGIGSTVSRMFGSVASGF
jgi:pilus assembly protein Flp/PilA